MKFAHLLTAVLLVGCAGQPEQPSHYLIRTSQHLDTRQLSPSAEFSLGNVVIASYIDQPGLVLETDDGRIEVAAVDPAASMQAIASPGLQDIATEVRDKLKKVVESL